MHILEDKSPRRTPVTLLFTAMLFAMLAFSLTAQAQISAVAKPSLVITPYNAARFYGDANPQLTGRVVGLAKGDTITVSYSTTANGTSPVGKYQIVATVNDPDNHLGNYNVTINTGVMSVDPAPLSVVANDVTRASGAPNPAFAGLVTGVKNNEDITASFDSAAAATSPAGTYAIVPTVKDAAGTLSNYALTVSNGTLTVTP
ncbi:MAG: MBG domain-containing protein [Actinomycetota bacterium]